MNQNHEIFMKRCIELALSGMGHTAPNPMVGSVVVHEGKVIGEGYHRQYGKAHAEVNAIESVQDKWLLKSSTLYVSLEPCSHFGKTPPCADLIIHHQIPKVIVGSLDPNPLVSGKGIEKLKQAGCEVTVGVLENECEELNKRFFTFQRFKRPYIIFKWAESSDGFLDKIRTPEEKPLWLTNKASRILVHKWRAEEQAILIGTNTAIMDNPQLNVRDWKGNNPVRMVMDTSLRLPGDLHVFDGSQRTIVFTKNEKLPTLENVEYVQIPENADILEFIMEYLYQQKITSVIVEGGAKLANTFIEKNLWDEARIFKGKAMLKQGVKAPVLNAQPLLEYSIGDVGLYYYRNIHKLC